MLEKYNTVNKFATTEIVIKKSRFISSVTPIANEIEAQNFIEKIKKENWNATHNVFAYQIGDNNEIQRCSDDGEPSGTAGLPVLDVLRGKDIKNTVIVVTRYFGGTLLGTGGLVRAYGKSASEGIEAAQIVEKILYKQFNIKVDYNLSGKIQYFFIQNNYIIKDTIYTDTVEFIVLVEVSRLKNFEKDINNITNGNLIMVEGSKVYGKYVEGNLILDEL